MRKLTKKFCTNTKIAAFLMTTTKLMMMILNYEIDDDQPLLYSEWWQLCQSLKDLFHLHRDFSDNNDDNNALWVK